MIEAVGVWVREQLHQEAQSTPKIPRVFSSHCGATMLLPLHPTLPLRPSIPPPLCFASCCPPAVSSSCAMQLLRACRVSLLLCCLAASIGSLQCDAVVGRADVSASDVMYGGDIDGSERAPSDSASGLVAALLSPPLAACVVSSQPGLAGFIEEQAAHYPQLKLVYTGNTPRLQIFHSAQHRRDNIVDSSEESDEQLIDRLQHPHSHHTPHTAHCTRGTAQCRVSSERCL